MKTADAATPELVRRYEWGGGEQDRVQLLEREWLVTNGLGGYASGTISAAQTRRYHGLLIAAEPAPLGRMLMLCDIEEHLDLDGSGRTIQLGGAERQGGLELHGAEWLREFRLEGGLPVWIYEIGEVQLEKRLMMPHLQNTTLVRYRLLGDDSARLRLRPTLRIRSHDDPVDVAMTERYTATRATAHEDDGALRLLVNAERPEGPRLPELRLIFSGADATYLENASVRQELLYRVEASRGYAAVGDLWSPGELCARLSPGSSVGVAASSESWAAVPVATDDESWQVERERRSMLISLAHPSLQEGVGAELVLAADQFVVEPATREEDASHARAEGGDARSIIAGYHWFTDWGRDTMISLEGLTLATGRRREAGAILRMFARHVRDGLIPNMFPEGESEGLYHTADATLWFFHALDRYVEMTGDTSTLERLRPTLHEIVKSHIAGTRFNIGIDPADGLLTQGAEGYQLTWMDAKVEGWVVTPRRGKAVELNALWYNALRVMIRFEELLGAASPGTPSASGAPSARGGASPPGTASPSGAPSASGTPSASGAPSARGGASPPGTASPSGVARPPEDLVSVEELTELAECCYESFNERFWYEEGGHLYDIVDGEDGDDAALRPNQVFAISLPNPVLEPSRWEPVMAAVKEQLLTPRGLRSLAPGHPDYKENYHGDLRTRDAAYHQGTVWSWLIGPYIDAWLRVHPNDTEGARAALNGLIEHLDEAGIGTISEVFDAEPPYHPRGCIAQAWGVSEALRGLRVIEG